MPHPFENCIPIFFNLSSRISGEVRGARLLPRRRPLPRRTVRRPGGMHQGGVPNQGRTQRRPRPNAVIVSDAQTFSGNLIFKTIYSLLPSCGSIGHIPVGCRLETSIEEAYPECCPTLVCDDHDEEEEEQYSGEPEVWSGSNAAPAQVRTLLRQGLDHQFKIILDRRPTTVSTTT